MTSNPPRDLPSSEWFKYAWVIGSSVQQDLRKAEGMEVTSPKDFQRKENLPLLEAIEHYNRIFCPDVNEKSREIRVTFKEKEYEIGELITEIIEDCWIGGEWESYGNRIGGDIRSIDFEKAYKIVAPRIVQPIIDGDIVPS
ncbi:MAG: hypothetical protein ACXAEU_04395 [Candidatus Hodarchaeales archaeon]|jgi:hypothetical protein